MRIAGGRWPPEQRQQQLISSRRDAWNKLDHASHHREKPNPSNHSWQNELQSFYHKAKATIRQSESWKRMSWQDC